VELGIYSFGDVQRDPVSGALGSTAEATRNLLEAIRLADQVGLDYFGIGEHHTREMPASAGPVVLGAAAATTERIRLGSAATVLSTDDPVRVYQQFATVDALSGGRAEIVAGRGSSVESFPLFGYELTEYDDLYEEKLALLLALDAAGPDEDVTWEGRYRAPLRAATIVPQPESGHLPIWRATGGSPDSSLRAGLQGLPVIYGIISGRAAPFGQLAALYRAAAQEAGHGPERVRVAVSNPGFVGDDSQAAKDLWWESYRRSWTELGARRGWPAPERRTYDATTAPGGALFVGNPEEVAASVVDLHRYMGHTRHILQMDLGNLAQRDLLRSIELLGTEVKPLVDAELGNDD